MPDRDDEVRAFHYAELEDQRDRSDRQDMLADDRHQETVAARRRQARKLRSVAFGVALALLLIGGVLTVLTRAARNANDSAKKADKATACMTLLFGSVANKQIDPDAVALGCDTRAARDIIASIHNRDLVLQQTQEEVRRDACAVLPSLPQTPALRRLAADAQC